MPIKSISVAPEGSRFKGPEGTLAGGPIDFLVIGAQKCGTSALDSYLRRHGQLSLPPRRKELHFFDADALFDVAGDADYTVYHQQFEPIKQGALRGEVTPIYLYWRPCAERIYRYNPAIKLIVILRDPVERAFSHWNMERLRGAEPLSFELALKAESKRLAMEPGGQHRVFSYVDRGRYYEQLCRFWRLFRREQMLMLSSEELRVNPNAVLRKIQQFLEISAFPPSEPESHHSLAYKEVLDANLRAFMKDAFKASAEALKPHLPFEVPGWLR